MELAQHLDRLAALLDAERDEERARFEDARRRASGCLALHRPAHPARDCPRQNARPIPLGMCYPI